MYVKKELAVCVLLSFTAEAPDMSQRPAFSVDEIKCLDINFFYLFWVSCRDPFSSMPTSVLSPLFPSRPHPRLGEIMGLSNATVWRWSAASLRACT